MPRVKQSPWLCDDDIQGPRRERIIREHIRWLEHRHLESKPDLSQYPLARWLMNHRATLARRRSETLAFRYRNSK